ADPVSAAERAETRASDPVPAAPASSAPTPAAPRAPTLLEEAQELRRLLFSANGPVSIAAAPRPADTRPGPELASRPS
ncbi:MAG: hypothetical protein L6R48_17930, partial [Planctomycetes bacterium]|nr:hypothetical protein [Planctomycetota bacterium]